MTRIWSLRLLPLTLVALPLGCLSDDGAADGDASADTGSSDTGTDPTATSTMSTTPSTTMSASDSDSDSTGPDPDTTGTGVPTLCEVTPGAWEAPDWEANTADALAVRAALDALTGDPLMRGAETGAVELESLEQLSAAWDGTPSLAELAPPAYGEVVERCFAEFVDLIAAGEQDLIDAGGNWAPGEAGGVWGDSDRGINEGGLEVRQFVDKGSFGGGPLYAYAVGLTEGEITPATIDAIAAAWGNNATLAPMIDDMNALTDAANYSFQMGFHTQMAESLAAAKAYAADEACALERDEALVAFFRSWEQGMYARLVFYVHRAIGKLLVAETDTEFADVLHDLGEGAGVGMGMLGLADPATGPLAGGARTIDDAQIEAAMSAIGIDLEDLGASTQGQFVESLPALEDAQETIEDLVMDVYGVDAAAIQSYRMPTPG